MPVVTLTTDFGVRDPYVAAMKGVVCAACPGVQVIDLTHDIAPQDVLEGALFLAGAAPHFPAGTIHVAVVDPGVGTARNPLVVAAGGQVFVCPDNGLITLFAREHPIAEARVIANPAFLRHPVSPTFHGRDVFAPAAGRLAGGARIEEAGDRIEEVVLLDVPCPERDSGGQVRGAVLHVDRFGNAITNIPRSFLGEGDVGSVCVGSHRIERLHTTYGEVDAGQPLALIGSTGHLEVAVRDGHAGRQLQLERDTPVAVGVSP